MNPQNAENKCFQYTASVVLNYEDINWRSERVSNFKFRNGLVIHQK